MATTKLWKIDSIECKKQDQGFDDVVYTVHWRLYGINGQLSASVYGSQTLTFDPTDPDYVFVPYEELDEQTVLGWVKSSLGEESVSNFELNVDKQIDQLMNPPVETKRLPWVTI